MVEARRQPRCDGRSSTGPVARSRGTYGAPAGTRACRPRSRAIAGASGRELRSTPAQRVPHRNRGRGDRAARGPMRSRLRLERDRRQSRDHRPGLRRPCGPTGRRRSPWRRGHAVTSVAGIQTASEITAPASRKSSMRSPRARNSTCICINSEVSLGQAKDYAKANGITIVNMSPDVREQLARRRQRRPGHAGRDRRGRAGERDPLGRSRQGTGRSSHWSGNLQLAAAQSESSTTSRRATSGTRSFIQAGSNDMRVPQVGRAGQCRANDYDLYLAHAAATERSSPSRRMSQSGSQAPTEDMCYTNPGGTQNVPYRRLARVRRLTAPRFDMIAVFPNLEYVVSAGSLDRAGVVTEHDGGRGVVLGRRLAAVV